ncbi:PA2169 family four-helix-bundle protein [uncultured Marixanthomonas sp.]|uniref:ferritin-like domain-containing protein n=1 Tax=uncultured Marixanthomonas sp. TaxID=757245 RepID=UPI0030DA5D77|tara:strand:- start:103518 stop:103970 length:453 start_codon:yes stop_codon:yes gene_type:complete
MSESKMCKKVNDLIEKNNDAAKGFREAADHAESNQLKTFLKKQSKEREAFANELSVKLRAYHPDVDLDTDGSVAGAVHRGWLKVKAALSADDDESILEECMRGDRIAREEYKEVLADYTDLSKELMDVVSEQKLKLEKTLQKVKTLEDIK